jgi:hypothetical protein
MKTPTLLIAAAVLAAGVCAQTPPGPQLPDRPAVALSKYKDAWVPVVGVEPVGTIALDSAGRVVLPPDAGIALTVGGRYGDGFVTVADAHSVDVPPVRNAEEAETMAASFKVTAETYEAGLTSDADLPGAYAIFILPAPPGKGDEAPSLAVLARPIGDLKAGKPAHLSATLPKPDEKEGRDWALLVYCAGRQVRSTGMGDVLPAYFDALENSALRRHIAERVQKGADAPIAVFRELPLGLPGAIEAKYHGATVKVRVSVDASGRVVSAKPVDGDDPQLAQAVEAGFGPWLFLPPVRDGAAAPGSAIVPLKM